jgi:hypothetical protein
MKSSDAAVVLVHELQQVSVRPRSALREIRKISIKPFVLLCNGTVLLTSS